jgi:hypothetical protein
MKAATMAIINTTTNKTAKVCPLILLPSSDFNQHQLLPELNRLTVLNEDFNDPTCHRRADLVLNPQRVNPAKGLTALHIVTDLNQRLPVLQPTDNANPI